MFWVVVDVGLGCVVVWFGLGGWLVCVVFLMLGLNMYSVLFHVFCMSYGQVLFMLNTTTRL